MDEDIKYDFNIDRGGTFTDFYSKIHLKNGQNKVEIFKLLSKDPDSYKDAPTEGIRRTIEKYSKKLIPKDSLVPSYQIKSIKMGTTVATNALLERKGAKTALLITKGFGDLLIIGNQDRDKIFDLVSKAPELIYNQVIEIPERIRIIKQNESINDLIANKIMFLFI